MAYVTGRFALLNPDQVEATVTLTMKVEDWKRLREQLNKAWPSWELKAVIDKLIGAAEKHLTESSGGEE